MTPKAKNWTIGIVCFIAGMLFTVIGFFALTIYVSFIRDADNKVHTQQPEEQEETVDMVDEETMRMNEPFHLPALDSRQCEPLSVTAIEQGSYWTDGDVYFQVLSNAGDSVYMVGSTLEDDGMEILFRIDDDATLHTDGASVFAMHDSPVVARQIRLADGSLTQVLVAYYDTDMLRPQAILQRWHGKVR